MAKARNTQYELGNSVKNTGGGGISFCGLLTILFIGLKLTGYINWSWIWVLAPLWLPATILITILFLFFAFLMLGLGITLLLEYITKKSK